MSRFSVCILDFFIAALGFLVVGLMVTGGTTFSIGGAKIEVSQLFVFVLLLLLLVGLRKVVVRNQPVPFIGMIERVLTWLSSERRGPKVAAVLVGGGFFVLFVAHVFRHWSFVTNNLDMGLVHQALYYPFGPPALKCDGCLNGTYFAEHLSFVFYLLAPVTSIFRSDLLLFGVQALLVAVPVWFGIRHGPLRRYGAILGLAAFITIAHPALRDNLIFDLREDNFGFASMLGAGLFLLNGRIWPYLLFLMIAMLSKENFGFATLFFVFPILIDPNLPFTRGQRVRLASFTAVLSLVWLGAAFKLIIPFFAAGQSDVNNIVYRLNQFGSSPAEVVANLLTSPVEVLSLFVERASDLKILKYLLLLLLPYAYFLRRAWWWLIPAVPGIAMNVLSSTDNQRNLIFHYQLIILPPLLIGVWQGIKKHEELRLNKGISVAKSWMVPLLIALALSGRWPMWWVTRNIPSWSDVRSARFLAQIPQEGSVAAEPFPLAHLAHVRNIKAFGWPADAPSGEVTSDWGKIEGVSVGIKRILVDRKAVSSAHGPKWASVFELTAHEKGWRLFRDDSAGRFAIYDR